MTQRSTYHRRRAQVTILEGPVHQFKPTDIGGCVLWLGPESLTEIDDGGAIGLWRDGSGRNNHVSQAIAASRPTCRVVNINGKTSKVVRFDGVDDYLSGGDIIEPPQITMFAVAMSTNIAQTRVFVGKGNGGSYLQSYTLANVGGKARSSISKAGPTDVPADSSATLSNSTFLIYTGRYDQLNVESRVNGVGLVQVAETAAIMYSTEPFAVGILGNLTSFSWNGDIVEIILYGEALNGGQRVVVEQYLSQKYPIMLV